MKQFQETLPVQTAGAGFTDITGAVNRLIGQSGIRTGLLTLFIRHTSASLTVQENADPDVMADLGRFLERIAPQDDRLYVHTYEGKDDMPAHIRTSLTDVSLSIPVAGGRMTLGTWQAVYVCEHRNHAAVRNVVFHLIGE